MTKFTWEAPNIHPVPGAQWISSATPTPWTKAEKEFAKGDFSQRSPLYHPPANVGAAFYKTLRKLGYTGDPVTGDYQ